MTPPYVVALNTIEHATLEAVGGKGANLAKLIHAGFPVPPAFAVTTRAYRDAVAPEGRADHIREAIAAAGDVEPEAAERAASAIQPRFSRQMLPEGIADAIRSAYEAMGSPPVAVRSSATAEDLPGLSFAGLHDTLLNVMGAEQLLDSVAACWRSLWTARAIAYRHRQGVDQTELAMAVVVQEMATAEAAGVLFTADPLTGLRDEMVIDAVLGLGEALVSGKVEPDRYVVARARNGSPARIERKAIGAKGLSTLARPEGGTYEAEEEGPQQTSQALPDEAVLELAEIGERIEALFGSPQDIEWAWSTGGLRVLQARPITSLYPVPGGPSDELRIFFSFAAVQGLLEPLTPLGQDTMRGIFGGLSGLFGGPVEPERQGIAFPAGERLWLDASAPLRTSVGRRALLRAFSFIEPGVASAAREALHDARLAKPNRHLPRPRTMARIAKAAGPIVLRFAVAQIAPAWSRRRAERTAEQTVNRFQERFARARTLADVLDAHEAVMRRALPTAVPHLVPRVAAGMAGLAMLRRLAGGADERDVLEVTRALPHNPTTEMDLDLWEASRHIASDTEAAEMLKSTASNDLARAYGHGALPPTVQEAIAGFMSRYGMRGTGEIDIGRPRWREQPAGVIETLQEYLRMEDPTRFPPVVFQAGGATASGAVERIVSSVRRGFTGPLKARIAQGAARRVRELAGLRETPKFMVVRLLGMSRAALLVQGQALVEAGALNAADDVFFLYMPELRALAAGAAVDHQALVAERRRLYAQEQRRRQLPLVLLSDGRVFHAAAPSGDSVDGLAGIPVSAGVVEGDVRVVFDPQGASLKAGEVLVCPGTDPAWTPLFLVAGGLVTEVGGLMTHGSVLAREYGIPAVVGVAGATTALKTGQRVRLDGSTGRVTILP